MIMNRRLLSGVNVPRPKAVLGTSLVALLTCSAAFAADPPSREEMWKVIQQQQKEIQALRGNQKITQKQVKQTKRAVEATADAMKNVGSGAQGWWDRTSIGGYGEVHYNAGNADQIDVHRFVLFIGHEYNDDIRLFTEFELEHALAGDGAPGEVELEQAWIEFDINKQASARAGVFLMPIGILNETHEPPTFYGVERNRIENRIIPSTWWEAGAGLAYNMDNGLRLDAALHSGLDMPNGNFLPRSGRQKVAEATQRDPAVTGRIRYTGIPGLEIASSVQYQSDVTQGDAGDTESSATLLEAHLDYKKPISKNMELGFRALYAKWDIDGSAAAALGRDKQFGYYVEPSIKFKRASGDVGFFARYSVDDNTDGDNTDSEFEELAFGMNYWPHENVVLKIDYQNQTPPTGTAEDDRINIGIGFQY
tara:strand:+ start:258 stop:1523 length:1266 start_codon:yes stop_codon:yes gene_type:complete